SVREFAIPNPTLSEGNSNMLGLDFMSRFAITFNFRERVVFLAKGKRYDQPALRDLSGLHLLRKDGKTVVHSVDEESAGWINGIKAGDTIVQVDGVTAGQLRLFQVRTLLCRPGTIRLSLRRDQEEHQVHMKLAVPWDSGKKAK